MRIAMLCLLSALLLASAWVLCSSPVHYETQDRVAIAEPASKTHLAGTDELGRDRAVRVALALLLGLAGACAASVLSSTLAMLLGSLAAFGPRWTSPVLLYCGDLFLTLPWLFLLMLIRSALPLTVPPVVSGLLTFLLLAFLGTFPFLRLNYERLAALTRADWLLQCYASGLKPAQIARQLLPHVRPVLWTQFLLYVPACLIAEANLGTLGLGLGEPLPSLGNFLANLQSAALLGGSRLIYLPVFVLVLVLIALELAIFGVET